MPVPIASRAAKHLDKMFNFKKFDDSSGWAKTFTLDPDETIFGLYENEPGKPDGSILITQKGLHITSSGKTRFVNYDDIKTGDFLHHDKHLLIHDPAARVLLIYLTNGETISLPILGSDGRYVDIAAFYSFVGGAIQTRQIERINSGAGS